MSISPAGRETGPRARTHRHTYPLGQTLLAAAELMQFTDDQDPDGTARND
jgi:hypothetical protein